MPVCKGRLAPSSAPEPREPVAVVCHVTGVMWQVSCDRCHVTGIMSYSTCIAASPTHCTGLITMLWSVLHCLHLICGLYVITDISSWCGGTATLGYAPSLVPRPLPNGPCPLPNGPRPLPNGGRQHAGDETIMHQLPSPPLHISLLQYSVHELVFYSPALETLAS